MTRTPLTWIGLAGVAADDNARAQDWQHRLDAVMIAIALLALPAYVLEVATTDATLQGLSHALDVAIFLAFLLETLWMVHVSSQPLRYLVENWLNVLILIAAATSVLGAPTEWVALIRTARVAVSSLLLVRAVAEVNILFTRKGAPLLLGTAALVMLGGGAMFYWLEPTIHTYWDGLWLAFTTGATSVRLSAPITFALYSRRSERRTVTSSAPSTTCALVMR
jgi:voltage-gated potassium channel